MGFGHDRYPRLRSGIMYTLNALGNEGHCFATREQLCKTGAELLEVDQALISDALDEMLKSGDVFLDGEAVYLPPFYHSEVGTARRLREVLRGRSAVTVRTEGLQQKIQASTGMNYDEVQMQAILTAVGSKVFILTGGPGTGKGPSATRAPGFSSPPPPEEPRSACPKPRAWRPKPSTASWRSSRPRVTSETKKTRWKATY